MTRLAQVEGLGDSKSGDERGKFASRSESAYEAPPPGEVDILKLMPTEHQSRQGQHKQSQSIQVCRTCGLVCEDESGPPKQPPVWITMREYRARVFVPLTQVFFTHTNCPDCLDSMGSSIPECAVVERTAGERIPATVESIGGADEALIALAEIILRYATKKAETKGV